MQDHQRRFAFIAKITVVKIHRSSQSMPAIKNRYPFSFKSKIHKGARIAFHLQFVLAFKAPCHTLYGMKMTMHINEELLERVITRFGFASKTEAVDAALREMDRKARFKEFIETGFDFSPEELENAVEPGYDIHAMRVAEQHSPYRKKSHVRKHRR